eukprot:1844114-Rhodomonas_salina.1
MGLYLFEEHPATDAYVRRIVAYEQKQSMHLTLPLRGFFNPTMREEVRTWLGKHKTPMASFAGKFPSDFEQVCKTCSNGIRVCKNN